MIFSLHQTRRSGALSTLNKTRRSGVFDCFTVNVQQVKQASLIHFPITCTTNIKVAPFSRCNAFSAKCISSHQQQTQNCIINFTAHTFKAKSGKHNIHFHEFINKVINVCMSGLLFIVSAIKFNLLPVIQIKNSRNPFSKSFISSLKKFIFSNHHNFLWRLICINRSGDQLACTGVSHCSFWIGAFEGYSKNG